MATITVHNGDVLEVRLSYQLAAQTCINSFHYVTGGLSSGTAQPTDVELATCFEGAIWAAGFGIGISNVLSDEVTNASLTYQVVNPTRSLALPTIPAITAGQVVGQACPPSTAFVVKRRSVIPGRKYRGRVFMAGLAATWADIGTIAAAHRAAVNTAVSRWNSVLTLSAAIGGVSSQTPYVFSARAPINKVPVLDTPVDFILRSQRRREVGRGI